MHSRWARPLGLSQFLSIDIATLGSVLASATELKEIHTVHYELLDEIKRLLHPKAT